MKLFFRKTWQTFIMFLEVISEFVAGVMVPCGFIGIMMITFSKGYWIWGIVLALVFLLYFSGVVAAIELREAKAEKEWNEKYRCGYIPSIKPIKPPYIEGDDE